MSRKEVLPDFCDSKTSFLIKVQLSDAGVACADNQLPCALVLCFQYGVVQQVRSDTFSLMYFRNSDDFDLDLVSAVLAKHVTSNDLVTNARCVNICIPYVRINIVPRRICQQEQAIW